MGEWVALFTIDDIPDFMEARWDLLMSEITPEMQRALKREAYMRLGNVADVQDVIQEVLIKAVRHYDQLEDKSKLYTWLVTITRRECLSHISRFSIKAFFIKVRLLTVFISQPMDVWDHLINNEEKQHLLKALEELKDESRSIVVLKSTTDLSLNEIAQKLHLNYHTTRSKYRRALSALRDIIQEDTSDERL